MLERAYSLVTIKGFDPERRSFSGIATSPVADRMGDTIDHRGVTYKNPLPLLLYHDGHKPVGEARFHKPTEHGTLFESTISTIDRPGVVKDRLDEAVDSLNAKPPLIRGVSIGFRPLKEPTYNKDTGGLHFSSIEVLELSMVVVPAHQDATIHTLKQFDVHRPAASGTGPSTSRSTPGVSGRTVDRSMTPVSEQLAEQRQTLQTKSARLEELMVAEETEGGLQPEETTERETLTGELKSITAKIGHLSALEAAQAAQATNATMPAMRMATPTQTRVEFKKKEPLQKGMLFTRYALSIAAGRGSYSDTLAYAKRYSDTPEIAAYVKMMWDRKAVEGTAVVSSPGWGGELVNPNTAMTEFVELLMPMTIIGRVPGFRKVPFNIPIITQTGGSLIDWVGEGGLKPVGELAFTRETLGWTKCAGIVVMTEELVRFSSPDAEERARQDLQEQVAKFLDEQFIQVGIAPGTNNPASITYNVTSPAASGTTVEALKADLQAALATFTAAKIPITGLVIVTTPDVALGISLLSTDLGQAPQGFNVTPTGGTLLGYPVIVSESVDPGVIVIFKPSEIFLASDGQVRLDASNQATLDMNTGSPTSPTFNLWQRDCIALRAEQFINWKKRRSDVVAVIDSAAYGPAAGSP
jgi:HK97 family phage major capsid protein